MGRKKTNEEFIADSNKLYPGLFTYKKCKYINQHTKITLTCLTHGDFEVSPNNHISRHVGCKVCSVNTRSSNRALSLDEFIVKAMAIHSRYNYTLVDYINIHTPVSIICNTHGQFTQSPANHIYKRQGCPTCYKESHRHNFLDSAVDVHGHAYSYNHVTYVHSNTNVHITCNKHGTFLQTPNNHTLGHGCQKCANSYTPTVEEFWNTCYDTHHCTYTYDETSYVNLSSKLNIHCEIHGTFNQIASTHIKGGMCPICMYRLNLGYTDSFFDLYPHKKNIHSMVYFVRLYNDQEECYKIGITTRSIQTRFKSEPYKIEILKYINTTWVKSHTIETILLQLAFTLGDKYVPTLNLNGKHECFIFSDETTKIESINIVKHALGQLNMKIIELNEKNIPGLFVGLRIDTKSKSNIAEFIKDNDIPNRTPNSKLHFTLIYSTTPVKDFEDQGTINPPWEAEVVGFELWDSPPNKFKDKHTSCCIMNVKCVEMKKRHKQILKDTTATHGFKEFKTHLTLSYDVPEDFDIDSLKWPHGPIMITNEYQEELNTNWNAR